MLSDATWGVSLSRYGSGDSLRDTERTLGAQAPVSSVLCGVKT